MKRPLTIKSRSASDNDHCTSERLKQLDGVPRWVLDEDLLAAVARHDLVAVAGAGATSWGGRLRGRGGAASPSRRDP
jgi:hypothetical protein